MILQKESLVVREIERKDALLLSKWLSDPEVLAFYEGRDNPFDLKKVEQKFFDREDVVTRCLVYFDDRPIGYVQFYPLETPERDLYGYSEDERVFGMDQFIGEAEEWSKGIGQKLITSVIDYLKEQKQARFIVLDPQVVNTRAIRCYEKCGFTRVKSLPDHEWHEGSFRDCWLMEYRAHKEK